MAACAVDQSVDSNTELPYRFRRQNSLATSRIVGGGTLGWQATRAAHSSLCPLVQAILWLSLFAYRACLQAPHRKGLRTSSNDQ